jgi:hypothetical protein
MFRVFVVLVASVSAVLAVQPSFNPKDIVRQAQQTRSRGSRAGLDGGEFLVDTNATRVSAIRNQTDPAVAYDGTNFLVVWEDTRNDTAGDIWGVRVTPAGTLLEPCGFPVSVSPDSQRAPAVAFDGANFLVVWEKPYGLGSESDIYGARVTPQGVVLDTSGFVVSAAAHRQQSPAVASNGTLCLVVWEDARSDSGFDVYGARVAQNGAVLDPAGIVVSNYMHSDDQPSVAFGDTNFLVVWQFHPYVDMHGIYCARVKPQGGVLDTVAIRIQSGSVYYYYSPSVAFDGTNWLVVSFSFGATRINGVFVTQQGVTNDVGSISPAVGGRSSAIAFDGTNYLLTYVSSNLRVKGTRVTPAGVELDTAGISIASRASTVMNVAFGGGCFLTAWQDTASLLADVYGTRVSPAGFVLDSAGITLSLAAFDQYSSSVAFDGTNYLVVWEDARNGLGYDIYGARVTTAGTILDPSAIAISTAVNSQSSPAVAFDGTNYLVVWDDGRRGSVTDIYGARVTQAGVVLDPLGGFAIDTSHYNQDSAAVAFDGANYLVVWNRGLSGSGTVIYGARVTPAGMVLDPSGIAISSAGHSHSPSVAFGDSNYLVVWTDSTISTYVDIYSARVTPAGVVRDPTGIRITSAANSQQYPAVSYDGTNFLAVWQDNRASLYYSDIYGTRVTEDRGLVLDTAGIRVCSAPYNQEHPAVVFDGTDNLVAWEDSRATSYYYNIYGARVSTLGLVHDSAEMVAQTGNQRHPALAHGPASQTFLVYQGWTVSVNGKAYNTDRIWGLLEPSGGVKDNPGLHIAGPKSAATVVHGVLFVPRSLEPSIPCALLDISGRKVMNLRAGANDVRALAPGIYFVRTAQAQAVRKVVLTE